MGRVIVFIKNKVIYTKQKIKLYFDENFSLKVVDEIRATKWLNKNCKICSVYDFNNNGKDDQFQFGFCKKKGFILVTLDNDFLDDRKFPFGKLPGIIVAKTKVKNAENIILSLKQFISFITLIARPLNFVGDSKFQISPNKCIMRGKDAKTREVKELVIDKKTMLSDVIAYFNYY